MLVGLALTALVFAADRAGWLTPAEYWLYHRRVAYFQFFTPPPSDKFVHLDIDDAALEVVGSWPWPRRRLAEILDELHLAGTDALAMDVIFGEPQEPRYGIDAEGKPTELIDDDAEFERAVREFGRVLIPIAITPTPHVATNPLKDAMQTLLTTNLELDLPQVVKILSPTNDLIAHGGPELTDYYIQARKGAMYERIDALLSHDDLTFPQAAAQLLPHENLYVTTPVLRLFERQFRHVQAIHSLDKFSKPMRPELPQMLHGYEDIAPITRLARAAAMSGYVTYVPFSDGVVRGVPLWIEYRGRLYPQFSLALACLTMGVDVKDLIITDHTVIIPKPDGTQVVIPTRQHYIEAAGRSYSGFVEIPWFGPREDWKDMYDFPDYREPRQHVPLNTVWSVIEIRERLAGNNHQIDFAVSKLLPLLDGAKATAYAAQIPPLDDFSARIPTIEYILANAADYMKFYEEMKPEELRDEDKAFMNLYRGLKGVLQINRTLEQSLHDKRDLLKQIFQGKAVLMGWTATAAAADFVPTSLHSRCPGVVVHGMIYNGILNGDLWKAAPLWFTPTVILVLGAMTTFLVTSFSPARAAVAAVSILLGWTLLNCLVMFDYGNIVADLGSPAFAVIAAWAGCTVMRFIAERAERARITRRFRAYVDPALVSYVIEHPEQAHLAGTQKEMSVVFTDLAGFTTLSERLGEKTVELLNEYMGLMVPLIRARGGFVNKFLGDGIMFFFSAPLDNPHHAQHAIETVMAMQQAMDPFNETLTQRNLPNVKMRAGIATGLMIVGDAGPPDASDYTVLGDVVNLAARLESANKAVGSLTMLSSRTAELAEGKFLFRPVGRLQVVGKSAGVLTYNPLCLIEAATDRQRELVTMTQTMVDAYVASQWWECINAADMLDAMFSPDKLTDLYRQTCRKYLVTPPKDFAGQLVLSEK